ncbi:endonuclease/exonuclease/phosphatase family metal-dependent hydrolase [Microvirga flocculans]|uniref:Endonuclease/exonuclease/phosphatase family metal-dependent hydrolase n=1 Tax=Microvirga flocculans TaxID=217168 RepID=A0A7W6ICI9_9HYPH|nr:endonuclease/exonuclease/phosphatase family protein [Microvirga flocculans]MBB4038485.1 endonuclease/exonuclease/phosphatase family metal-dependent hydrolase [Microvirga flocculans]
MRDIILQTCPAFPPTPLPELAAARQAPATRQAHDAIAGHIPALHAIELVPPPSPVPFGSTIRIAAWNAERCKYDRPSRRLLETVAADVTLLSEMDVGMARSGNRHTVQDLAGPLQQGFAFAVEFVELGLGDSREMRWHAGQSNTLSLHGNAIMSRSRLADAFVVPLDHGATWFSNSDADQRRLGGRMAIAARLAAAPSPLWVVSVHLESRSTPASRALQTRQLLDALRTRIGDAPAVIGGDFNTDALPSEPAALRAACQDPQSVEPLFSEMAEAGFTWSTCNDGQATQRMRPDGTPSAPFTRLDWLFARGVAVSGCRTWSAVDADGAAISDHELVSIDLQLA